MTQAFNLAQLANNLNTSGQLDATDGLTGLIANANLASSGTASSTTFLAGDRTWQTITTKVVNVFQTVPRSYYSYNQVAGNSEDMTAFDLTVTPSSRANYFLIDANLSCSMSPQGNAGFEIYENSSGSYTRIQDTSGTTYFNTNWSSIAPSANQYILMWYGFPPGSSNAEEQRTIRGTYLVKLNSTSGSSSFNFRLRMVMGETPPMNINFQTSNNTGAFWSAPSLSSVTAWEIKP